MVVLTPIEFLQGTLTFIFVLISLVLGLTIMSRYFKYKSRQFILVGISWMAVVSPYWPDAISYLLIITTGNELDTVLYIFIANAFIPLICITWGIVFTDFLYSNKKNKKIMTLVIMGGVGLTWELCVLVLFLSLNCIYELLMYRILEFYIILEFPRRSHIEFFELSY